MIRLKHAEPLDQIQAVHDISDPRHILQLLGLIIN